MTDFDSVFDNAPALGDDTGSLYDPTEGITARTRRRSWLDDKRDEVKSATPSSPSTAAPPAATASTPSPADPPAPELSHQESANPQSPFPQYSTSSGLGDETVSLDDLLDEPPTTRLDTPKSSPSPAPQPSPPPPSRPAPAAPATASPALVPVSAPASAGAEPAAPATPPVTHAPPPAQTPGPDFTDDQWDVTDPASIEDRRRPWQKLPPRTIIIAAAAAVILLMTIGGAVAIVPRLLASNNTPPPPSNPAFVTPAQLETTLAEDRSAVAGYSAVPAWTVTVPENSVSSATPHGVVVVAEGKILIYSIVDGSLLHEEAIDAPVDSALSSTVDGLDTVLWTTGGELRWWNENGPGNVKLPDDAQITTAGTSIMISDAAETRWYLAESELVAIPDSDYRYVAVDNTTPIGVNVGSTDGTNAISVGQNRITIAPPQSGMNVNRWAYVGRGQAVTIWSALPNPGPEDEAIIAVSDLGDGSLTSATRTTFDQVSGAKFLRTTGARYASFGPFILDLAEKNIVSVAPADVTLSGGPSGLIQASTPSGPGIVIDETIMVGGKTPLAVSPDLKTAIWRPDDTTIGGFLR